MGVCVCQNVKRTILDDVPLFHHGLEVWEGLAVPYLVKRGLPTKLEDFFAQFLLADWVLCQGPQGEMNDRGRGFVPDQGKRRNVLDELFGRDTVVFLLALSRAHCEIGGDIDK